MGSLSGMRTILNAGIAVGDLDAEDHGKDETQCCDESKYDYVLVTRPIERHVFAPEFRESKKGTGCEEEEKGHEDRG